MKNEFMLVRGTVLNIDGVCLRLLDDCWVEELVDNDGQKEVKGFHSDK